jgi:hypothetical protein
LVLAAIPPQTPTTHLHILKAFRVEAEAGEI